jgi:hypothetical protein
MKLLVTINFLFLAQIISAQSTLNINLWNCKTDAIDSIYSLNVFKDNNYFKTISLNEKSKFDTTLQDVDKGIYTIEYKSYFGETLFDTVKIIKDTAYWAFICIDEIKDYENQFKKITDSITINKQIVIEFESYGCFHWELQKLKVFKKGSHYFATLYPEIKRREKRVTKGIPQTKQLSELQIRLLCEFQLQSYIHASGFAGGTEFVSCNFKYKNSSVKVINGADTQAVRKLVKNLLKNIYGRTT